MYFGVKKRKTAFGKVRDAGSGAPRPDPYVTDKRIEVTHHVYVK